MRSAAPVVADDDRGRRARRRGGYLCPFTAQRRAASALPGHAVRWRLARGVLSAGRRWLDRDPLATRARGPRPKLATHACLRGAIRIPVAAAIRLPALGQDDRQRTAAIRRR